MSISATESAGSTAATGLSTLIAPAASPTGGPDKEMFLQLLVAQLKYQDPSNPADTSQFMAQSAQFTALEKMQDVADQTKLLLGAQMAFGASSLVGKQVDYTLPDGTSGSGTVGGVTFAATGPELDIAGVTVPLVDVTSVTAGSTSTSGSGSTSTSTAGSTTGSTTGA